ncbi:hypothetical protein [uncultured Gimesia sp.]|uniref:hypothetical protein n=1 Tax=uncultured Gimesia sp. TaxID=1678688 RepID=UPI00262B40FA|nr:hypothetical protein [uncultured Gimesia sp.]
MKIGLLKQYRSTVYSLAVILACLTVGCLRQPAEVISQSGKSADNPLIESHHSSSFNYFESKKKISPQQMVARRKVGGASPRVDALGFEEEEPVRIKLAGNYVPAPANSAEQIQKSARKIVDKRAENWRAKSLIESAKKYPSNVVATYHQSMDRIKLASGSTTKGISAGIEPVSNTVSASQELLATEGKIAATEVDTSAAELFRVEEVSRYNDQSAQQDAPSQTSQLGKNLPQDLKQEKPTFGDVNQEMRRFQINSVMERAKREAERKNYEYAAFLAEQALESSYRGHIAFNPEEESPQMLLQKIKSLVSPLQDTELRPIEHTKPDVQTNGGQIVQNFQFAPSAVHPLKRRPVATSKEIRPQPRTSSGTNNELPVIVPRNLGTEGQTNTIPRRNLPAPQERENPRGISLDTPSFDQQPEDTSEFPVPEKTHPRQSSSVPQRTLKLELEEIPNEPPAKIRLSGPEPVQRESVKEAEKSASPGPQLMLPNLPAVPQDLTSQADPHQNHQTTVLNQSGRNQGIPTAPVKFRSKIQENRQNDGDSETGIGQKLVGANENRPLVESALTLDEIEWDLDEKRRPQLKSAWSGMSTILLIIGGAIILLLLTIIVILLKRGNPST